MGLAVSSSSALDLWANWTAGPTCGPENGLGGPRWYQRLDMAGGLQGTSVSGLLQAS